jgi:hypothetical protein
MAASTPGWSLMASTVFRGWFGAFTGFRQPSAK